jgi:hypothetical protein
MSSTAQWTSDATLWTKTYNMMDEGHNMMNEDYNMIGYYCEEKTGHGSIKIAPVVHQCGGYL